VVIHYLSFAIRMLRRSRLYSAITIGGLALALASCILMLLFIRHEVGYDDWLPGVDNLVRVHLRLSSPGQAAYITARALAPLKDELANDLDIAAIARLVPLEHLAIEQDGRTVDAAIMACDPSVFEVLELPVVRGQRVLAEPTTALVTEQAARTYFGTADPIGKTLTIHGPRTTVIRIVGVLRDLPSQTHLALGIVTRIDVFDEPSYRAQLGSWHNVFAYTYLRLRPGADRSRVEHRIAAVLASRVPDIQAGETRISGRDLFSPVLIPVTDLHLHDTSNEAEMRPRGDATTLYAIAGVGALLLLIAAGNFLNLATARAARRAREIAIRKAAGAEPRDIIVQYLGEAVLVVVLALVLALVLVELALPWFEQLSGRELAPPYDPGLLAALVAGTVTLGLVSGIYPAIVLSRYQPARVMNQNQPSVASGSGRLRAVLVFAQFAAAIALAIGTMVVYRQTRYAADASIGFAKHDRLVIQGISGAARSNIRTWVEQAQRIPGVGAITLTSEAPGDGGGRNTIVEVPGHPESSGMWRAMYVDAEFFAASRIVPIAGRGFSRAVATDDSSVEPVPGREAGVVINEAAVRRLGLATADQAVGRDLQVGVRVGRNAPFRVIGVVPDIQFQSIRQAVEPTVFVENANWFATAIVELGAGPAPRRALESLWIGMFADHPFRAELLETAVDAQYRNERRLAAILTAAAVLALAVACLGLYGLSSFITESRRKEIAIRKVLGASTLDVIRLLAWQLARPVALACVIAAPVAYLASERWLGQFAYRISVGPAWIAGTIATALAIAAGTVAIQGVRSARATPIDALRAA